VELLLDELIINEKLPLGNFQDMLICLTKYEQRQFLLSTIRIMDSKSIAPDNDSSAGSSSPERIAASITLLTTMLIEARSMAGDLIHHISSLPCNLDLVRIVVGALQIPYVEQLLQKVWEQFGDKLHIKHDSIMQQESTARTLLLCAAKLHRAEPMSVFMHARSSLHANTMSNRLGSSSARIRLLGIFVGQAISQLTDKTDESQMNFELEGAEADEAGEWAELIYTEDKPVPLTILSHISTKAIEPVPTTKTRKVKPIKSTQSTKPRIIEVLSGSEDDDLKPYAKPDSDPEDSDEDATLVQRNKPKAPVYIRDLLSGLLDSANPLVHTLALDSAAPLISRKSSFGSELLDQLPALAACLAGLQDHFDTEDFDELRQAAMVSTIVAQPRTMGPWYAKECFIGDYSIGQRAGMLIAIGLAARELGGFERVKDNSKRSQPKLREAFPSKVLPSKRLHMLYGGQVDTHGQQARPIVQSLQTAEVDTLTRLMSQSMLTPISTRKSASVAVKSRTRVIRNDLASIVAECFFFPLTGYWAASTRSRYICIFKIKVQTVLPLS
jgi:telomere length regulation protein